RDFLPVRVHLLRRRHVRDGGDHLAGDPDADPGRLVGPHQRHRPLRRAADPLSGLRPGRRRRLPSRGALDLALDLARSAPREHGSTAVTELDPVIHAAARLRITAALATLEVTESIAFPRLQELL